MMPMGENRSARRKVCPTAAAPTTVTPAGPGSPHIVPYVPPHGMRFLDRKVPIFFRPKTGMSNCYQPPACHLQRFMARDTWRIEMQFVPHSEHVDVSQNRIPDKGLIGMLQLPWSSAGAEPLCTDSPWNWTTIGV
jgi:hypothetical protein